MRNVRELANRAQVWWPLFFLLALFVENGVAFAARACLMDPAVHRHVPTERQAENLSGQPCDMQTGVCCMAPSLKSAEQSASSDTLNAAFSHVASIFQPPLAAESREGKESRAARIVNPRLFILFQKLLM